MKISFARSAAALLLLASAVPAYADPAVALLSAHNVQGSGWSVNGTVQVQNLAYTKQVSVVYQVGTGAWSQVAATYVGPTSGGFEAWTFQTPGAYLASGTASSVQFAIRYDVAGTTYWDNNGGQNYTVGIGSTMWPVAPAFILGWSNVALENGSGSKSTDATGKVTAYLYGAIALKNLGYTKQVAIVYTTDGWRTQNVGLATYNRNLYSGVEEWTFNLVVPGTPASVQYVVRYTVNGQTYWDNNLNRNYVATY